MNNKKVLVVGASGQIGEALALALAKENRVTGIARFRDATSRKCLQEAGVTLLVKDLASDPLTDLCDEYDVVFNQAVDWPGPPERGVDIPLVLNGYLQGRLMERTSSAIHIYGSTMAVPDNAPPIIDEETPVRRQNSVYGATKLVGEALTTHLSEFRGVRAAILRYMWPCGGKQLRTPQDALLGVVRKVLAGETFQLERRQLCQPPDGSTTKEILGATATPLHVDDIAALTVKAVEIAARPPEVIHVFGPVLPMSEILKEIGEVFGVQPKTEIVETTSSAPIPYYSRAKMLRLLGEQTIPLRQILERMKAVMQATGNSVERK